MKPLKQWTKQELIDFFKGVDKKTWVVIGASLAGVGILWFFLIGPAWFERPRLRSEIQKMDTQIRQYQMLDQKRLKLEENQKVFSQLLADVQARLFGEEDLALLLGQISKLAYDARVDIAASKPKAEAVEFPAPYASRYEAVAYDFTMQGGYHQLGKFSAALESYPKWLRIQKIKITPLKDDALRHLAQFELVAIKDKTAKKAG